MKAELIIIPAPGAGHLLSMVELAKLIVSRDARIHVSILIIRLPFESGVDGFNKDASENVAFLDVPALDDIALAEVKSLPRISFLDSFIAKHGSADGCPVVIAAARRLRETKAILINTVWELESHAIKSLVDDAKTPVIYHVGPVINFKSGEEPSNGRTSGEDVVSWLDRQPPSSVVYLCFGSSGSFDGEQIGEIARALELSGQRYLWSLRRPSQGKDQVVLLQDYDDYNEVLPQGFLERTSGKGKIIGWAPQLSILSHPSVGGFVSHCGWNSILESIWCGVPIATWPMYAEQQVNAFQLVVDLGLAAEIKMDYRKDRVADMESTGVVSAEEIERGIRRVMDGESEMRKKMKELKDACRKATQPGGSSYTSLGEFIQDVTNSIREGALN
uniref:UDP-glycosyltransferase n=1 Tax=Daucus carota subsp. sativus TaxID=79200 RepID=A0A161ZTW0_DAUCS